jgi:hypothetical protein
MDPYKARQDVTEVMLLEELDAQSHDMTYAILKPKHYNCEEKWRKTAWKLLYLSSS